MQLIRTIAAAVRAAAGRPGRRQTVTLLWHEPPHPAREDDPHYQVFEAYRRRLKLGPNWRCAVPGCPRTDIELHHRLPYALAAGVDLAKLERREGRAFTAESFAAWLHTTNTEPLCDGHHRLAHAIPAPAWTALLVWRDDLPSPVEVLSRKDKVV